MTTYMTSKKEMCRLSLKQAHWPAIRNAVRPAHFAVVLVAFIILCMLIFSPRSLAVQPFLPAGVEIGPAATLASSTEVGGAELSLGTLSGDGNFVSQTLLTARRLRIQRIVLGLDRVGDVASQMMPENADRIDPILEDLEDRAVSLSDRDQIQRASVDDELTTLEGSVRRLSTVVSKMIEPEMTL